MVLILRIKGLFDFNPLKQLVFFILTLLSYQQICINEGLSVIFCLTLFVDIIWYGKIAKLNFYVFAVELGTKLVGFFDSEFGDPPKIPSAGGSTRVPDVLLYYYCTKRILLH